MHEFVCVCSQYLNLGCVCTMSTSLVVCTVNAQVCVCDHYLNMSRTVIGM